MPKRNQRKLVRTVCTEKDGGSCGLLAHVVDGVLVKIEPADFPEPGYRHICAKGLSLPKLVYHPDRLKYPMKRIGERGKGQWQRISWDEALKTIANQLHNMAEKYGASSMGWISNEGKILSGPMYQRFASAWGGTWISTLGPGDAAAPCADITSYGALICYAELGGYTACFENPQMYIAWGSNLAETTVPYYRRLMAAKEKGAKIVVIDPRFTPTAAKADAYLPIRPGTDAALALGMINLIINRNLHDESFITQFTVGPLLFRNDNGMFLREKDIASDESTDSYIVWDKKTNSFKRPNQPGVIPVLKGSYNVNGISCKPAFQLLAELAALYPLERTSRITEIEPDAIEKFALDCAKLKPLACYRGWGLQRTFHGDLSYRAILTLLAITGNVGTTSIDNFLFYLNWGTFYSPEGKVFRHLPLLCAYDTILSEDPYPLKGLWIAGSNLLNQSPNTNKIIKEILPRIELIVVVDMFMTLTAEYADIVLPVCSSFECNNLVMGFTHPYLQLQQKVIEPLHESKSDFNIIVDLAKKMDLGKYFDKSPEEFLQMILSSGHPVMKGITLEKLKQGPVRARSSGDPPYSTPSGRIELYSEKLQEFNEALPVYKEPLESRNSPEAQKYPLCFLQTHTRSWTHSMFTNIDWLRQMNPSPVLEINPVDAQKRGIQDGDTVVVFNNRGTVKIKAMVHQGIKPGVVSTTQGWWPKDFIDGHHQNLTHDAVNPAQKAVHEPNVAFYDVLVDVEKAQAK